MVNMDSKFCTKVEIKNEKNCDLDKDIVGSASVNKTTTKIQKRRIPAASDDMIMHEAQIKKHRQSMSLPVTPKKITSRTPILLDDPLTPTSNLKMLVSAAFDLQMKKEGSEKRDLFNGEEEVQEDSCSTVSDSVEDKEKHEDLDFNAQLDFAVGGSRKLKSLGLLCQK